MTAIMEKLASYWAYPFVWYAFVVGVLIALCSSLLGVTLVMATLNVFFRDTRFLWSVISLLWTYATPIFYPDTIWPEGLRGIFHLNPMYQLIDFLRQIVIAGIPPTPERLLACGAGAFGMLMIGLVIFQRYEKKFVFHL